MLALLLALQPRGGLLPLALATSPGTSSETPLPLPSPARGWQRADAAPVISLDGPAPVVAMNVSHGRNYFPAALSWAGSTLLLATNTESDDLHDSGMKGLISLSGNAGASWSAMPQPLALWQVDDCCLPLSGQNGGSEHLAFSYTLRRRSPTDYTNAYVHAEVLTSGSVGGSLRQTAVRNVSFRFGHSEFQPAGFHKMGCPQSPDTKRCDHGLAQPTQSFQWSNTGTIIRLVEGSLLTTAYGVYRRDQTSHPTPAANVSAAVFRSSTGGASWEWLRTAAGSSAAHPAHPDCVGASENHVERLADGSLLMVYRVANDTHVLCFTASKDGVEWSAGAPLRGGAVLNGSALPQRDPWGVAPRLMRLSCGLLALTTGRPGIMLWLATDPPTTWRPYNLAAHHNRLLPAARFTSNCSSFAAAHPKGGAEDCIIPTADVPGRGGAGSTTSYTGLTQAQPCNATHSSVLRIST